MEIDCIGLFVNNMETMVKFYRDIIGLKTNWNGEPNADFEAGKCRLIMFGRNDFENLVMYLIQKAIYWKLVRLGHNMASDLDYVQYVIDQKNQWKNNI